MRVLIVDDDDLVARALGRFLTLRGHEPVIALTAERALKVLLFDEPVRCILLDVNLGPGQPSGLEVARMRRSIVRLADVCVIIMSGLPESEIRAMERNDELHDARFFEKPINLDELAKALDSVA